MPDQYEIGGADIVDQDEEYARRLYEREFRHAKKEQRMIAE
jgi:hypothetical protein